MPFAPSIICCHDIRRISSRVGMRPLPDNPSPAPDPNHFFAYACTVCIMGLRPKAPSRVWRAHSAASRIGLSGIG